MSLGGNLTLFGVWLFFFNLRNVSVSKTGLYLDVGARGIQSFLEFPHTFFNKCMSC